MNKVDYSALQIQLGSEYDGGSPGNTPNPGRPSIDVFVQERQMTQRKQTSSAVPQGEIAAGQTKKGHPK
jgi:hypothetical protein